MEIPAANDYQRDRHLESYHPTLLHLPALAEGVHDQLACHGGQSAVIFVCQALEDS
jgi:hypothetical protein